MCGNAFQKGTRVLSCRNERGMPDCNWDACEACATGSPNHIPTISFDFCFLCQKDQGTSIPTMVGREHRCKYTQAFKCPGKSTKEEEYSDQIVSRCAKFVDSLGYKRVAMKSDQERSMRALQQRTVAQSRAGFSVYG